ncbi:MAG TPA: PAS domain-containing sensor histidine kinase [Gammaproteobacteria bacterium]|nr:PAS domain-containing sensor histidine kinase [Gammaproteobacteria bacterium]|tara:strand:+ start:8012 stop:9115 length:1104 start_codon:yes stop_codon:yes gene_type:complete
MSSKQSYSPFNDAATSSRDVIDALITAVIVLDSDLRVTFVNTAAEQILGLSASQAQGQLMQRLLIRTDTLVPALRRALDERQPFTARDTRLHLPDQVIEDVDLSTSLLDHTQGLVIEMRPTTRLNTISQNRSSAATQETTRSLIRGLAHEVKNPLGGIRGAAQLLERDLPTAELREYTRVIINEADRLSSLVDRMLGPRQVPLTEPQNLPELCEHVIQILASDSLQTGQTPIEWHRDYDPSLPEVEADRDQLIQALLNVAKNACEALVNQAQGHVCVKTRVIRQFTIGTVRHRQVICLSVSDNGPGIEPEMLEKIFFPMISGKSNGSGLGLAIAQNIISQHQGTIQVSSKPGQTTFSIYLPFTQETN